MLKTLGWLIGGVIAGGVIVWWTMPGAIDSPDTMQPDSVLLDELAELAERIERLEGEASQGNGDGVALARRIADLEQELARIADSLGRLEALVAAAHDDEPVDVIAPITSRRVPDTNFDLRSETGPFPPRSLYGVDVGPEGFVVMEVTVTVMVSVHPGQAEYLGSSRNGVDSQDYGEWGRSFSLQRLQLPVP